MNHNLPLVYIAGPITLPDPVWNTHTATVFADRLYTENVCVPLIPHMNMLWHFIVPHETDYWYSYDLHLLARCDALYRLPGESKGAEAEIMYANELGLPVFLDELELRDWCRQYGWRRQKEQLEADKVRLYSEWETAESEAEQCEVWIRYS